MRTAPPAGLLNWVLLAIAILVLIALLSWLL